MQVVRRISVVALLAAVGLGTAGAAVGRQIAGPYPVPRCQPICERQARPGSAVTAIYVSASRGAHPMLTVDSFIAGARRVPTGTLCYELRKPNPFNGCIGAAQARGRNIGRGMWWLHFRIPVKTLGELSGGSSTQLARRYWVAVLAGDAEGGHAGILALSEAGLV